MPTDKHYTLTVTAGTQSYEMFFWKVVLIDTRNAAGNYALLHAGTSLPCAEGDLSIPYDSVAVRLRMGIKSFFYGNLCQGLVNIALQDKT